MKNLKKFNNFKFKIIKTNCITLQIEDYEETVTSNKITENKAELFPNYLWNRNNTFPDFTRL